MELMEENLKNKIQSIFLYPLSKRGLWFGVFFFVFLGLILPSQFAQAGFLDVLASIPVAIVTVALQVILLISNLVFSLAALILGWVVGPYFTTLPYTYGGVVDIGWPLVRDFINMLFIIALVIIGLSTALRIKEYQAQKALPILIIIAILINFTPVICGLIVDASNILMNFFLEELTGGRVFVNFMSMQGSILKELFSLSHIGDLRYAANALGKTIVMIIFDWVAAYIYLLYSFLFIMRYVMIWALVIISPIAFFSKVFPAAQKYLFKSILGWDEWWKEFIEWSLMGVIAGFFLYLAEQLMMLSPGMFSGRGLAPGEGGWLGNPIVEFVNNFLPWMVVLVFLWIGYKITKSTSAMGAQGLIKAVDTGLKMLGTSAIAAATLGVGAAGAAGLMGKATAGAARAESFLGKRALTKPLQYLVGKPTKWATRGAEKAAAPYLEKYAYREKEVAQRESEAAKKRDVHGNLRALRRATTDAERLGIIRSMADQKQIKDALDENVVGAGNVLTNEEAKKAYKKARQFRDKDAIEDIESSFVHREGMPGAFAEIVDKETAGYKKEDRTGARAGRPSGLDKRDIEEYGYTSYAEKIIAGAKSEDDMKKFQKGLWSAKDKEGKLWAIEAALKNYGGNQIGAATRAFGKTFSSPFQAGAEEKGAEWFYEIDKNTGKMRNPHVPKYFISTPAQGTYTPLKDAETTTEIGERLERGREKEIEERERKTAVAPPPPELTQVSDEELRTGKTASPPEQFIKGGYAEAIREEAKKLDEAFKGLLDDIRRTESAITRLERGETLSPFLEEKLKERGLPTTLPELRSQHSLLETALASRRRRKEPERRNILIQRAEMIEEELRKRGAEEKREAETERLIEEWPKVEKGMTKDVKGAIGRGEKMISEIKDQEVKIKSLESAIKEWQDSLDSLRESITKTEEQIARGLLGGDALKRANESLARMRTELDETERKRTEIETQKASIEPARAAVEESKINLSELYKTVIEPFQEVEKERKEAEKKLKEVKEKTKKAKEKKL